MVKTMKWLTAGALCAAAVGVHAQVSPQVSPLQVRAWASACMNCHGTEGRAEPGMESLAGKNRDDMLRTMLDFKSGRKPATIMHQISKGYTEEQLQLIAAYFAAQK